MVQVLPSKSLASMDLRLGFGKLVIVIPHGSRQCKTAASAEEVALTWKPYKPMRRLSCDVMKWAWSLGRRVQGLGFSGVWFRGSSLFSAHFGVNVWVSWLPGPGPYKTKTCRALDPLPPKPRKPQTLNPIPGTLNPKPLNPEPGTLNPKPLNPKPGTLNP